MISYTMLPVQVHIFDAPMNIAPQPNTLTVLYVLAGHITIQSDTDRQLHTQDILTLPDQGADMSVTPWADSCYALIYINALHIESRNDFRSLPFQIDTSRPGFTYDLNLQATLDEFLTAYFSKEGVEQQTLLQKLNRLVDSLLENNAAPTEASPNMPPRGSSKHTAQRLRNHLHYLLDFGYTRPLSLDFLAGELHLTPQYISLLSKQLFGESFNKYLTALRLGCAAKHLLHSDMNVTQITAACGFPNVKALNSAFQKHYQCSPSQYKKQHDGSRLPLLFSDNSSYLSSQELYFASPQTFPAARPAFAGQKKITGSLADAQPFTPPQADIVYLGAGQNLLSILCQQQLQILQQTSNVRYVRLNHLFPEKGSSREVHFDAIRILTTLQSLNLSPVICCLLFPYEQSDQRFIRFFDLCLDYFGIEAIKNWKFEYCPFKNLLFDASKRDLDDIVLQISNITGYLKSHSPEIQVGSNFFASLFPTENAEYYCRALAERQIYPDFTVINLYPIHMEQKDHSLLMSVTDSDASLSKANYRLSGNPSYCYQKLKGFHALLEAIYGQRHIPVYANIIIDLHANNLLNDTLFTATFMLMNFLKTHAFAEKFILPILSDNYHFAYSGQNAMLQGINSLYTTDSIPKPLAFALQFLKTTGNRKIALGDSYMITLDDSQNITCLLLNYKHPSLFFCNHPKALTAKDVNAIFKEYSPEETDIELSLTQPASYLVEELSLNREHGSILDLWLNSNEVYQPNAHIIRHLKELLHPSYRFYQLTAEDTLKLHVSLESHEIKLIKLHRIYHHPR